MKIICYTLVFLTFASISQSQTWKKIAAMPGDGRDAGITFTIGDSIYAGGGSGGKDFYKYDQQSNKWTKKADIPGVTLNRGFAIGFSINGKGYVGTGTDQNVSVLKSDLWEYDPALNTWTQKADFPGGKRDGLGVFVINNKAYVGGGSDASFYVHQDFYEYDPATDTWTQKADLGSGYTVFPAMFSIDNYGYLTCGAGQTEFNDLYRYDPSTDSWDSMSPFPEDSARQTCVAFVLGGKGYVGLGQRNYDTVFTALCSYDPVKDEWKKITDIPGKGRAWAMTAVIGNNAYIGNGWDFGASFFSDWYAFSPTSASVQNAPGKENSTLYCFPDPAPNTIQIGGMTSGLNYEISFSDMVGREIIHLSFLSRSETSPTLDISGLRPGTYNVAITNGVKFTTTKFIKE